ncbi:MAG: glycosyltransferase family 4 protein [Clostridiales bacterium]|nr:glycosyltransferase family 4 protein [Clostridiales bacterium]
MMKPLNVLLIMNFRAEYKGNFILSVLSLEKAVEKLGGTVSYLFPAEAKKRAWADEMIKSGKYVRFLPSDFLKSVKLLKEIISERKITVVHSHFITSKSYVPLYFASLFKNIPHIFHAHSVPKHGKRRVVDFFKRRLMNAKLVVCVSKNVERLYTELGFNCVTVTNGIDLSRLDDVGDSVSVPKLPGKKAVLMFGYDIAIKGIDTAVRSLMKYDCDDEYRLFVCVASHIEEVKAELKNISGDYFEKIFFLSPTPHVAAYYRAADVFLSASRHEGLPYAVCEAAYIGLPEALSDIPAHRELDIPGAVCFKPDNERELYEALRRVSSLGAEEKASLGERERKYISDNFSMDKWSDAITDIYRSII